VLVLSPMTDNNTNETNDARRDLSRRIAAEESRPGLESLRNLLTDRLHRRSDDFDATFGLRLVTLKLQRLSYGDPVVTTSS
jgi:hypothetical protein